MTNLTMLDNGRLRTQDENGRTIEIGAEHPDYQRLAAAYRSSIRPTPRSCLIAIACILIGAGCWWFSWRQLVTEGSYDLRISMAGPFAFFGGLLRLFRPQWAGPLRKDSPKSQVAGIVVLMVVILVSEGINQYLLEHYRP